MKVDESKINRESNRMLDITGFVEEANGSNNNPQYLFNEYKRLYETEKYSQALEYLIRSLNKGFPNAEFGMGQHYYFGSEQLELSKDYSKAFHCFSVAAEQGHPRAQYSLGLMFFKGEGIASNVYQAILLFEKAANQGLNEALDLLGKLYHHGYNEISPDYKQAEKYYKFAVNQNYPPSMFHLALLLENLKRYEEADEIMIQSAKTGYIQAMSYNLCTYK